MIQGMEQVIEYESAASRLSYTVKRGGKRVKPDSAPTITIYNPSGAEILAATSMSALSAATNGFIAYDAQTGEFGIGETLTGGTSGATGKIVGDERSGAAGILRLENVDGTFQDDETITDSGSGSADADGTLYTTEYYYDVDASATSTYALGQNYRAEIVYEISSIAYKRLLYFDVVYYTMAHPIVTNEDMTILRAHWIAERPEEWTDWVPAINRAHAKLVRRIHSFNEQAADFVKHEQELWEIEFAFTCREIGLACGFEKEIQTTLDSAAESAWEQRGRLTINQDDDGDLELDKVTPFNSGFVR